MDERTLKALRGSIEKWEGIVAEEGDDLGGCNCPLCKLFYSEDIPHQDYCRGCPVSEKSGEQYCHNTPYDDWMLADRHEADRCTADTPEAVEAATEMLNFLKSLLPAGADATNRKDGDQ